MRYILHYTEPGDIVFDGFCGTGMTGVAAQMCGNKAEVESLGLKVEDDGTILQEETDENGEKYWKAFSKLGTRKAVLNDISPFATFISNSLLFHQDLTKFRSDIENIYLELEKEYGWMYETVHFDGNKGRINYTIWSEVYLCDNCSKEIVFWDSAVDRENALVTDKFQCPYCKANLEKQNLEKIWYSFFDQNSGVNRKTLKLVPVLISYSIDGKKFEKVPDKNDIELINKLSEMKVPFFIPMDEISHGDKTSDPLSAGINYIYQYYTNRNLYILSAFWSKCSNLLKPIITSMLENHTSKRNRYILDKNHTMGTTGGPLTGTLYLPPLQCEVNVFNIFLKTAKKYLNSWYKENKNDITLSTHSSTDKKVFYNSFDYIFLDPPFGSNYMYSELNYSWESWLQVKTNIKQEAIENKTQSKSLFEYRMLIQQALKNAYYALKPGRWITIEFSNTKTAVWNSIQTALSEAGFIVASVSILDKKHGGLKSMTYAAAVKQDLVISAYKPNGGFEERFIKEADSEEGVWDFIRTHLGYLPVVKIQNKEILPVDERQPRILFDHVIAYYVRKGIQIPIASSQVFQAGLKEKFDERDGMYFLHEQALEYDKKKLLTSSVKQSELFVINEESAIQWLKSILSDKPQAIQDIYPEYMQKLTGFDKKEEKLELKTLLEQNFIEDDTGKWHVPDPENAVHVEKIREKALLREFETYKTMSKKLKIFRVEAVRAGFKKAYQDHDYETILKVANTLSGDAIEEDPMLLMWYTSAQTRLGKE
jgi:DNA modification methylase/DNA-directed RNA polymerase subunit RPC12/RpoP